jgi:hypothetical protein
MRFTILALMFAVGQVAILLAFLKSTIVFLSSPPLFDRPDPGERAELAHMLFGLQVLTCVAASWALFIVRNFLQRRWSDKPD